MSNEKIRGWVYRGLAVLILCGIAWYFLMRQSPYDADMAREIFSSRKSAMKTVAQFLIDRNVQTDILDKLTVDNHYGIPAEDSDEYRAFSNALTELMTTEFDTVRSHNGVISFETPNGGGLLLRSHAVITYVPSPGNMALGMPLSESKWYYEIVDGKASD